MKYYPLSIYSDHPEVHFERYIAARLARVSEMFILKCERKELIKPRTMLHGKTGISAADVRKLKFIRHFHEDMGMDLEAVDFILMYRNRIQTIHRRIEEMERRLQYRESKYRAELLALRLKLARI